MSVLYDHRGKPLPSQDELEREHFRSSSNGWWEDEEASVETLTPARVARMMRDADDGDPEEYLLVAAELERRDLHYQGVLFQRKTAVSNAPVVVKAASDSDHDRKLAQAVTDHLVPRLPVFHMQDALGKGIAYLEILWDTSVPWRPRGFKWRQPTRFKLVDGVPHLMSPDRQSSEPLPWAKYVVHEPQLKSGIPIKGGLARLVAFAFALKHFTIRDLARFLEVYGIPARIGRYKQGSLKGDERGKVIRELVRLGTDAVGLLPEEVRIDLLETKSKGGPEGFIQVAQWWDRQVSKAVIGQTMTSDEGSSLSQSKTHDRVRIDVARHDAKVTGETLNAQLVRVFIDINFGVQDRYPSLVLEVKDPENLAAWSQATTQFIDRGLQVPQRVVRERLGISDPDPDDEVLEPIVRGPSAGADPNDDANAPEDSENEGDEDSNPGA